MSNKEILMKISKLVLLKIIVYRVYMSIYTIIFSYLLQEGINHTVEEVAKMPIQLNLLLILVSTSLFIISKYLYGLHLEVIRNKIAEEVGLRTMTGYLNQPLLSIERIHDGEIINNINEDVKTIADYISKGLFPLIEFFLTLITGLIYILFISNELFVFYVITSYLFFSLNKSYFKKHTKNFGEYIKASDNHKSLFNSIYRAFPIIRIYQLNNWLTVKHEKAFSWRENKYTKYIDVISSNNALIDSGLILVQLFSLIIGLFIVFNNGMLLGTMVGVWNIGINAVVRPSGRLPNYMDYMAKQKIAYKRINSYIGQKNNKLRNTNFNSQNIEKIAMKNINFSYGSKRVLKNFNIELPAKGIHFIFGESGSGKSTVFKLLMGVYEPDKGKVLGYEKEGKQVRVSSIIDFVPQNNVMFEITLRDNLTLGRNKVTDEEIENTCKKVNIWELIESLPNGLDTVYGKGEKFSSGQIRRLSIARSLLTKKPYILLDEPFSDLDLHNQGFLIEVFEELKNERSFIIISHTDDFAKHGDNIFRMEYLNEKLNKFL